MNFHTISESRLQKLQNYDFISILLYIYLFLSASAIFSYLIVYFVYNPDPAILETDYIAFWSAGQFALQGSPSAGYDIVPFQEMMARGQGFPTSEIKYFLNPPYFLFIMAPLAFFPLYTSLSIWSILTVSFYLRVIYKIIPSHKAMLAALAFPPLLITASTGQTGALTAALLGGFLLCMNSKPVLAGILIGFLTFKPQLGVLIPLCLIAAGNWRVFISACVTTIILVLLSFIIFGWESWTGFFAMLAEAEQNYLQQGRLGFKLQSLYSVLRYWGVQPFYCWIVHGLGIASITLINVYVWRKPFSYELKATCLCLGSLMVTPYIIFYEFPILAVAAAFLWRLGEGTGFLPGERTVIMLFPPFMFLFIFKHYPMALIGVLLLALLLLRRIVKEIPQISKKQNIQNAL